MTNDEMDELVDELVSGKITPDEFKKRAAKLTKIPAETSLGSFADEAITRAEIRSQARIASSI